MTILKIIAQISSLKETYCLIDAIYREHKGIVKNVTKRKREIEFVNGDFLKIISTSGKTIDGLRADVAIGPHAGCITLASNKAEKIWSFSDLGEYLKTIK